MILSGPHWKTIIVLEKVEFGNKDIIHQGNAGGREEGRGRERASKRAP